MTVPIASNPINGFYAAPNMNICTPWSTTSTPNILAKSWLMDIGYSAIAATIS